MLNEHLVFFLTPASATFNFLKGSPNKACLATRPSTYGDASSFLLYV